MGAGRETGGGNVNVFVYVSMCAGQLKVAVTLAREIKRLMGGESGRISI